MSNGPKASVLLPVYNAQLYLETAITSVLNQTFNEFELLLLNDGSTDSSEDIIDDFCKKDSRCKKLSWSNSGLIYTLNRGISASNSEFIIRMDADDICHPERFQKQWDFLKNNPNCVAVGSRVLLIDHADLPIMEFSGIQGHDTIDSMHLEGIGGAIAHPSAMIRKAAMLSVGGYRSTFKHAEDIDLFLRLAEVGKLENLPQVLLSYRQHAESIGYSKRLEQYNSAMAAVSSARERRGLPQKTTYNHDSVIASPSKDAIYNKWAWWSLKGRNKKTARKYAMKAFLNAPYKLNNIKVLFCALRGY